MSLVKGVDAPPCVMCLKPALKQCSGCHAYWYCDKECQRKHWRTHKSECGKVNELQKMTPKKLLDELEEKERQFQAATEIVQKQRENGECKSVWIVRGGEHLKEDLHDARVLPGIKDHLDNFDEAPETHHNASINTLFSAAEGVGQAKSTKYFQDIKPLKEQLEEMARKDEEAGTETIIKVGGQTSMNLTGEEALALAQEALNLKDKVEASQAPAATTTTGTTLTAVEEAKEEPTPDETSTSGPSPGVNGMEDVE